MPAYEAVRSVRSWFGRLDLAKRYGLAYTLTGAIQRVQPAIKCARPLSAERCVISPVGVSGVPGNTRRFTSDHDFRGRSQRREERLSKSQDREFSAIVLINHWAYSEGFIPKRSGQRGAILACRLFVQRGASTYSPPLFGEYCHHAICEVASYYNRVSGARRLRFHFCLASA